MNENFEEATKNDIKKLKYHRMRLELVIGVVWIVDRRSERDTIHILHMVRMINAKCGQDNNRGARAKRNIKKCYSSWLLLVS